MNMLIIIILAILQGLTEFLPVSSSGHLVFLYNIFNINNNRIALSVILHLATLLSVLIYYRKSIYKLIKKPFCSTNLRIFTSTIFTVAIALLLKKYINESFAGNYLSLGFMITAIVLIISQFIHNNKPKSNDIINLNVSFIKSMFIGIFQGVACFPGISRSGSTIACALISKCNKEDATTYSFLLSIPIIIASTILEIIEMSQTSFLLDFSIFELVIGFIVAFWVGLLAIKWMTKIVSNGKLYYFSFYLLILSIVSAFV